MMVRVRVKTLCKLLSKLTSCWCCSRRRRRRVEEDEVWAYPSFLPALVDDEDDEDESVVLIREEEKEVEMEEVEEVEEVEDAGAAEDSDVQEIEEISEDREIAEEDVGLEEIEEIEEIQPEVVTADVVAEEIGEDFPERQTMSLAGLFSGPSIWAGAEEELNVQRWTGWDLSDLEDLVRAAGGSTGDVGSHHHHHHHHQRETEVSFDDNVDDCCEIDDYLGEIFDVVFQQQQQQQQPAFVEELSGDAADHVVLQQETEPETEIDVDDLDEDELMKMVPDLVHAISEAEAVITPTFAEEALTPIRTFSSNVGDGDGDLPNLSGLSDLSGVSLSDLSPLARMDVDDAIEYYDASQLQIVVDNAPLPPWRRCETFELTEEGWTRVPELPSFYNDLWMPGPGMGSDGDTVKLNNKDPVARRMFPKSAAAKAAAAKDDLNRVKEKYRRFNEIVFGDLPEVWEEDKWMPNIVCFSELSKLWDD